MVGGGVRNPEDALVVARRARELGFTSTVGILHDGRGQLRAAGRARDEGLPGAARSSAAGATLRFNGVFQDNLALGRPNDWSCRAGARYLYVDEHGIVHYCSQQRGVPGHPARGLRPGGHRARVRDPEGLRPLLHDQLRAAGGDSSTTGARPQTGPRASCPRPVRRGSRRRGELAEGVRDRSAD